MLYRLAAYLLCIAFLNIGSCNGAWAAATLASEIDQNAVCDQLPTGGYKLNVSRFLAWAFDENGVTRACVDRNKDGDETFEERRQLAEDPYSGGPKCTSADAVYSIVSAVLENPGSSFRVAKYGGGPATPADLLARPSRVAVACLNVKSQVAATSGKPFKLSDTKLGRWKLKLRGNQNDLAADGGTEFKKAEAALLSFSGDNIEQSNKITAKAALGLDSGYVPIGSAAEYRLIPYVKFDSQYVETPDKKNDVDKLAFGLLGDLFYVGDPLTAVVTFDPQYLTDSDQESEIVAGSLRFDPTLTVRHNPLVTIPGGEMPLLPFLNYDYSIDGLVRFGRVIDPGNKPELLETGNFLYYGPVFDLSFLGVGFLEPLKINLNYYYLWPSEGQFKRIENFSASASLELDKDGHMEFKVSYDNGRDYENFAEREKWLAALGYKF